MQIHTLLETPALSVMDYRCSAAPGDKPYAESFSSYSISYVRKGSFGYSSRGRRHDLVPGSLPQSASRGDSDVSLEELGLTLVRRFV